MISDQSLLLSTSVLNESTSVLNDIYIYIYLVAYIEFAVLNSNYSTLLQSFPEDHGLTLNTLIDHFTDEQVTFILDSTGALAANQKMLNFLIGQLTEKADIIPLCDSLDKIGNATLSQAVEKLRNGNSVFYTTAKSYCTVYNSSRENCNIPDQVHVRANYVHLVKYLTL